MKVTPMLFTTDLVCALLDGRKVQTRRPIKINCVEKHPQDERLLIAKIGKKQYWFNSQPDHPHNILRACPYGTAGDLIYVRETWASHFIWAGVKPSEIYHSDGKSCLFYKADGGITCGCNEGQKEKAWRPSIHMPRWASRLTLKITNVRVERVQDISEEDAVAEGMPTTEEAKEMAIKAGMSWYQHPSVWFRSAWNHLYSNWNDNPWVWVIEFEVIHQNVDAYLAKLEQVT